MKKVIFGFVLMAILFSTTAVYGQSLERMETLYNEGLQFYNQQDFRGAAQKWEEALEIARSIKNKGAESALLANLGIVYDNLGEYQKAISYYEQALEIFREIGGKKRIGDILTNLGVVYQRLGDYPKAILYYEQSLKIKRDIVDKKGIGDILTNLGVIYQNLGDYSKAISYYEQALKIKRELGDKKGIGNVLTNLGNVYSNLGDYSKAISYYEEVLAIYKEIGIPTGQVEANIADIWLKRGEVERAEKTYLRLGGPIRLGKLSLVKGNYRKAVEYFDKSLKENLQSRNATFLFADYAGLGEAYEGLKEYDKAKENYENATSMAEEQREALAEDEKSRFFMAEMHGFKRIQPYERMIPVLIALNRSEEAFFYSENLKARVLAEAIVRGKSNLEYSLPSKLAEKENAYTTKIRGLRRQMEALYRNKAMDTYYEREKELKEVKADQQEFIRRLRESSPEYASITYPQPIKSNEVELEPNEVLIEFEVTDEASYTLMLRDSKLKIRKVPISREKLQELVLEYRSFFEGIKEKTQLLRYSPEVGNILYRILFGNLLQSIAKGSTLIIVPDEFLGILPFEALVTELPSLKMIGEGEQGPFPRKVKYLGDKYFVTYCQSATTLTLLRKLKKGRISGERVLVVADPIFSPKDPRLKGTTGAKVRAREEREEVASIVDELFPPLPKTEELARKIVSLFGNKVKVLLRLDAREDKVVESLSSEYRYLVFATPEILGNTVPWIREPALVLTQVGNPKGYDGFLTMTEIIGLKLEAEVAVLIACQTGVGENVSGEGVMGMGRAFQFAGTSNVLVSLWPVAEDSATQFASAFFQHLKKGKETRKAIRCARRDIRDQGYEHPFYWAAFILVGR